MIRLYFILLLATNICLFNSRDSTAQEIKLTSKADLNFHLDNQNIGTGSIIQRNEKEPVLTIKDFISVQIQQNSDSPYPDYSYSLLFRLTQEGSQKLDSLSKVHEGRSMALLSHGNNFNSKQLGNSFSGEWLYWSAPLSKSVAKKWLDHITGKELLKKPK